MSDSVNLHLAYDTISTDELGDEIRVPIATKIDMGAYNSCHYGDGRLYFATPAGNTWVEVNDIINGHITQDTPQYKLYWQGGIQRVA